MARLRFCSSLCRRRLALIRLENAPTWMNRSGACLGLGFAGGGAHLHQAGAFRQDAQLGCRGIGEVNDAVGVKGSAIVDLDHRAATVAEVCDPDVGGQWELLVRGGHGVHVVGLAAAGAPAMKLGAVPGCYALLAVAPAAVHYLVAAPENRVGVGIAVTAPGLRLGDRISNPAGIDLTLRGAVGYHRWWRGGATRKQSDQSQERCAVFNQLASPSLFSAAGSPCSAGRRPWRKDCCGCSV